MAPKRDVTTEILERRKRLHSRVDRWRQFSSRNDAVIDAYFYLSEHNGAPRRIKLELLRWIRVGMVAAMEAYYRMAVRDLVDAGDPFRRRAATLYDARLELSTVLSIQSEQISIGELVAHIMPLTRLNDVAHTMSVLLERDFIKDIKATIPQGRRETLQQLVPDFYPVVEHLYAMRNIHAHEFGMKPVPKRQEVFHELGAATYLVFVTEQLLEATLSSLA